MSDEYEIQVVCGCVIARGIPPGSGLPMDAAGKIGRLLPNKGKGAVMDVDLGRIHGAEVVAGSPENLAWLREAPETSARAERLSASLPRGLSREARHWAVWGEQGRSSQAIFIAFTGVVPATAKTGAWHPLDAADFRRCLLLVDQVPEFAPRVPELASLSHEWAGLVAAWDAIAEAFERHAPQWRSAAPSLTRDLSEMVSAAISRGLPPPVPCA